MNRILLTVVRKEIIHILRDFQSLMMVLLMPLLMLFLFGYAITLDMRQINTAVIDESRTPESRALIARFASTDFFRIATREVPTSAVGDLFKERAARCVIIIPSSFARALSSASGAAVSVIVDASDPNAATLINNYVSQVVASYTSSSGAAPHAPFVLSPRILYNPDMRSANFFVPGLISLILILITSLLTSIAIVREKENGTMEQILVSPIHPGALILGKVIPYTLIGFIDGVMILVVGSLWFNVPIAGSFLLALAMMLVYIVTGISLGILVSTIAKTQAVAMLAAVLITVLPSLMMSGFIFPISSMPRIFRWVSAIIPATYFIEIIRGIVLKGNTIVNLYPQACVLLGMDLLLILLSVRTFRVRLG